jgi:hypothetical protein
MLKPSKHTEDKAYRGLAYHDEWTQSHSSWTNNHQSFYITLRDVYRKALFAEKVRIHKENCDAISDVYGFMTAFRYDMQIRMNTFAHRVPSKDGAAVPDILVKQSLVIEKCYSLVRSFGEASWKDNLYAPGQSHTNYDPDTGARRPELSKSASYPSTHTKMGGSHQGQGNHQGRRGGTTQLRVGDNIKITATITKIFTLPSNFSINPVQIYKTPRITCIKIIRVTQCIPAHPVSTKIEKGCKETAVGLTITKKNLRQ